jgi:hypothetical protein
MQIALAGSPLLLLGGTMRATGFFLFSSVLVATSIGSSAFADEDTCKLVGDLGEKIMTLRQNRASLQSTLVDVKATMDPKFHASLEDMIIAAYEVPAYNSDELKKRAIGDFRDQTQLGCMKGRKKAD